MALGHGVSDVDTGLIMSCSTGGVYSTSITSISKSYCYEPGRLLGNISYSEDLTGIIYGNSDSGIYGRFAADYVEEKYGNETSMYIARGREVKKGTAYIYSRLLGELRKYEIEIEQVDRWSGDKNVEFHVVDEELLTLTGGVVQGMSGSTIVQDGKLIGAVTHVFVDDPTRGYGIFIEEMVKE
jgi:stage IV sporulation protein B